MVMAGGAVLYNSPESDKSAWEIIGQTISDLSEPTFPDIQAMKKVSQQWKHWDMMNEWGENYPNIK